MKFIYSTAMMLIVPACLALGQSEVSVSKNDFKTDKPGFDAAWKHVKDGDKFYSDGGIWFTNAMNEYRAAYVYNSRNAELNYKLGVSCLYSDKKEEAAKYFLESLKIKNDVADDILLLTGRALQYAGRFSDAEEKLNQWLTSDLKKSPENISRANRYLAECKSAKIILKDSLSMEIRNMGGNINSDADEYSIVVSSDGNKIYFASRRPTSPQSKNYLADTKFDENIYRSDLENGKWSVALLAGKNLTTPNCETPLDIDPTGKILYIYAGYEGGGDLMVSEFRKGEWRSPVPESFGINTPMPETSFSISPSGKELAFISERGKKGDGGKDIFFMKNDGRKWSKPVNAGENINSDSNEESVRFSRTGDTLWFSSSGRNTIGGYDIFYSIRTKDGSWSPAVNAGSPLNTPWNEYFYFPSPASKDTFYFVSDRSGGFGGLDIYTGSRLAAKPVLPAVKTDTVKVKTDTIPKPVMQAIDTLKTSDTSAVKMTIRK